MKSLSTLLARILFLINLALALAFILSAWSPWLVHPNEHPFISLWGFFMPLFFLANLGFVVLWLIFKWKFACISLLSFLICQGQLRTYFPLNFREEKIPQEAIKVLSYNVMGFNKLIKDGTPTHNPILAYIKKADADIVCLQEYRVRLGEDDYQISEKDIRKALKQYPYYRKVEVGKDLNPGQNLALFSRFPILTVTPFYFEDSANGAAVFRLLIDKDTVNVVNCHLESNKMTREDKVIYEGLIKNPETNGAKAGAKLLIHKLAEATSKRSLQADTIASWMKLHPGSYFLCGDFNDIPTSYTHRILLGNGKDAYVESGRGLGISYNQNKFFFRIDNILHSTDWKALKCKVDNSISESDHFPIWADFVRKKD